MELGVRYGLSYETPVHGQPAVLKYQFFRYVSTAHIFLYTTSESPGRHTRGSRERFICGLGDSWNRD